MAEEEIKAVMDEMPYGLYIIGALEDQSAQALYRAVLTLDVPYRIVQLLDPDRDAARLEAFALPPEPAPVAYVCLGTACSAPVTEPSALANTVRQIRSSDIRTLQ